MVAGLQACDVDESAVDTQLPRLIVFKSASCSCCAAWVKHMQQAGFRVKVNNVDDLGLVKKRLGIPPAMGSCHTAEVGDYFIEGHVPAEDVKRLLAEHPKARGLTVPGMPIGSPGMEIPSRKAQAYDVYLIASDGTSSVFAHHAGSQSGHEHDAGREPHSPEHDEGSVDDDHSKAPPQQH